jgi:hypothetical protein
VTNAGGTIGVQMPGRRRVHGRVPRNARVQSGSPAVRRANLLAAMFALAGVVVPAGLQISLGPGVTFTPGRIGAALLFFPAMLVLCKKGRHFVLCDFLAFATVAWMIVASIASAGESAIATAGGDALDFLGGYLISRAYFFGRPALDTFIRVLKIFAIIVIILAMADTISGRPIVHNTIVPWDETWLEGQMRNGWVRAMSTFDHPILFGVFCALTAAILLYWEKTLLRRSVSAGLCLLGCVLSLSSAALMAFSIILVAFTYDQLLRRYPWRWSAFWIIMGTLIFVVFVLAAHPLNWVLTHLTLDPQTGYFRMLIWDTALAYIAQSPVIGFAYHLNNVILDNSVDCIWLVLSLRFGVPMFVLFFLTNVAAFFPSRRNFKVTGDVHIDQMHRAFTLVLLMFMFTGLTVHFWKSMLMFWGLCLGIRASLRELTIETEIGSNVRNHQKAFASAMVH